MPGGVLPPILVHTPDVGFEREMIGAVICPVWTSKGFVGCQRLFIEQDGTPIEYRLYSNKDPVRKAALGRCDGGACVIGEPKPGEPVVLCEGVETAVMIHQLTHWCVMACISAGGMERVDLELVQAQLDGSHSVVIVAGDLDKSERGQRAMVRSADRIRFGLKVAVAECIPSRQEFPALVDSNEKPIEGKSVDWEDAIKYLNETFPGYVPSITSGAERSTTDLTKPEDFEEVVEEQCEPHIEVKAEVEVESDPPTPRDTRRFEPYADVYPGQQLDAAHEYLLAHHRPQKFDRQIGGGLHLICFTETAYLWKQTHWEKYSGKMLEMLRGHVRRYFRRHCKAVVTKENPPRLHYVDAKLSKSEVESVTTAVIDEVRVLLPASDFTAQFWLKPSVEYSGIGHMEVNEDNPPWERIVESPVESGMPDPNILISTPSGLFDVEAWRTQNELNLYPHSPLYFNLGYIEASIPFDKARSALKEGGLDRLEQVARAMCPDWIKYLNESFRHSDPECAPTVAREIHKFIGCLIAGETRYQRGSIGWFVGTPGTGKSILFGVKRAILGKTNMISTSMDNLDDKYHLRSWIGKRYAAFPDMELGRVDKRKLTELIKKISGGDEITIPQKFKDEIENAEIQTRFGIGTNQIPSIPDPTMALLRRSIAFNFLNPIPEQSKDHFLLERITSPESLAGIVLLSLIGIKHLDADGGFIQPKWYAGLLNDLKSQASDYAEMIEECIVICTDKPDDHWVSKYDLFKLYIKSIEAQGSRYTPKMSTVITELKVCLNGYGWPSYDESRNPEGDKGYKGLKINDRGMELLNKSQGSDAGGHDRFIPV